MIQRLPLNGVRRLAVLLLLVGVMLGGSIDAAACEPEGEFAAVVVSTAAGDSQTSDHQLPASHDGACMHGHCHHGVSDIQPMAGLAGAPGYLVAAHAWSLERSLTSVIPDTLKRPPRA